MNFINKIWSRIRVWFRLQQIKADKDIIEAVKSGIKRIERKETLECQHENLTKLLPKHFWYRCKKCKMIFYIHGADGWEENALKTLLNDLRQAIDPKVDKLPKRDKNKQEKANKEV